MAFGISRRSKSERVVIGKDDETVTGVVDARRPVLVGVGTASDDCEAAELMAIATRRAAQDAAGPGAGRLLAAIQRIAVPQGSWRYPDPARLIAERVGAKSARTAYVELGIPQQSLINDALREIQSGKLDVAVVVGGEARAWSRHGDDGRQETSQPDAVPDEHQKPALPIMIQEELSAGAGMPVAQYAMIDNALRAAEHKSLADQRDEVSGLWSRFNAVAQDNPLAAFPEPRKADWLAEAGPGNQALAFPYNRWHASQWTVNQAAALVLCSAEAARRYDVPTDRWVFPLVALDSSLAVTLSQRRRPHRWEAMEVLGRAAAHHLGIELQSLAITEVYSCFPAAVRVQQRELRLPLDGTPTLTGGMAFAGGPLNNFVYQAMGRLIPLVRERTGEAAMITTVSGILTKPGLGVWCTEPRGELLLADLTDEAAAGTEIAEVIADYDGPGTIATYTVFGRPDRGRPRRLIAIVDVPNGDRCLATTEDGSLIDEAVQKEMIGQAIEVRERTLIV